MRYCWIDLETTGLTDEDLILEIAAVVTDETLKPVGMPFEALLPVPEARLLLAEPVVRDMHRGSGLWRDVVELAEAHGVESVADHGFWLAEADLGLARWLSDSDATGATVAGAGVAQFDRRVIRQDLPNLDRLLHPYHTLDTSQVRRFLQLAGVSLPVPEPVEPHRAMPDLEASLAAARLYVAALRGIPRPHLEVLG